MISTGRSASMMESACCGALEAEGIEVVDNQQACSTPARSDRRRIELLKVAASMVGATIDIARDPSRRKENELVAIANDRLFRMGAERVECVNSVSGRRGRLTAHVLGSHDPPGDMIFLDIMHSFNSYRTCYRTFICGEPQELTPMRPLPGGSAPRST